MKLNTLRLAGVFCTLAIATACGIWVDPMDNTPTDLSAGALNSVFVDNDGEACCVGDFYRHARARRSDPPRPVAQRSGAPDRWIRRPALAWPFSRRSGGAALPGAAALAAHEPVAGEGAGLSERFLPEHGVAAHGAHRSRSFALLGLAESGCLRHAGLPGAASTRISARSLASAASEVGPMAKLTGPGRSIMSRPVAFSGGLVPVCQAIHVPPVPVVKVM